MKKKITIIGAGLAGLSCAIKLKKNFDVTILEAGSMVGGRVKTENYNGYKLDKGFVVLLESYPLVKDLVDFKSLNLKRFKAGTIVRSNGKFHKVYNPIRNPLGGFFSIFSPIGSFSDKVKLLKLFSRAKFSSVNKILQQQKTSTQDLLENKYKFSNKMIDRFFRPFMSGVFFEKNLQTSSHLFEFTTKMFLGYVSLPEQGIGAIPHQLASSLSANSLYLNTKVTKISENLTISTESGDQFGSDIVVLATDRLTASKLLPEVSDSKWNSTTCLYFSADSPPYKEALLTINADSDLITNLAVLTNINSSYAPPNKHLISVNLVGTYDESDPEIERMVRSELKTWYGSEINKWELLKIIKIPFAQPNQDPNENKLETQQIRENLFICGDYMESATFYGAMKSGLNIATKIKEQFLE